MTPDYEKGVKWLQYAAYADEGDPDGGNPEARYELACCYYEGKGIKKNIKHALKLFRSTIELFNEYEENCSISNEPEYITKARKILVNNGYKSEINKIKKAAENKFWQPFIFV